MKLELKHLAPYLPYRLKFIDCGERAIHSRFELVADGQKNLGDIAFYQALNFKEFEARPILRPLSDLTKEIEGKGFSTLHRINLLLGSDLELRHDTWSMYIDGSWTNSYTELPYEIVQILLENHFDVFGLIEQGLAIDINTLPATAIEASYPFDQREKDTAESGNLSP